MHFDKNGLMLEALKDVAESSETRQRAGMLYAAADCLFYLINNVLELIMIKQSTETKLRKETFEFMQQTQIMLRLIQEGPDVIEVKKKSFESERRILIVEDDAVAGLGARRSLKSAGSYQISWVKCVKTALEHLKEQNFDLVLTDINLPDGSGMDVAKIYRAFERETGRARIPIFALTGYVGERREDCLASGIDQVFVKPLDAQAMQVIQTTLIGYANQTLAINGFSDLSAYVLFDVMQANALLGEDLKGFITLWLQESLPETHVILHQAHANQDWNTIQQYVHKLKGSSAYIRTLRLYHACAAFEDYLIADKILEREILFKQFIQVMIDTEDALRDWIRS